MIQIYTDGALAYDSRLEEYSLLGLATTTALNKGGVAEITMPPHHPAYGDYMNYRTLVEIYKNNKLHFRGRALYPTDDFYNRRTVTCEGELCFFRDGVSRPYLYQDAPAAIFAEVVQLYNYQVEEFKQFQVGIVTVTDPNNYIRLESEKAEQCLDTLNKLLDRCGGYFVFTTNDEGKRVINWLADLGYRSSQVIEFGENLLNFSRDGSNTDLATVIIPYGAKNEDTGERVTIESVNDGLDFIQDLDAVAIRGVIAKAVYWDDVTTPDNLLRKAQQYLNDSRHIITSLELTALDLSNLDQNIDSYQVGDTIRVRSKPHAVDDDFQLTERTEDLLDPSRDSIVLGKDIKTLTDADVAGDNQALGELERVQHSIKSDYTLGITQAVQAAQQTLSSLIEQASESIRLEVSESYATNDQVTELVSTTMTQLSDSFNFLFTELQTVVDANDAEAREHFLEIEKYIKFVDGDIVLGETGNELTLRIENDRISFLDSGAEVAYFSNKQLVVLDGHFIHSLRIGPVAFIPRANGNISLVKVGE